MAGVDIDSLEDLSRLAAAARKPPVPNSAMELDEDAEGKGKGKKRTALGEDGQPKKKTKRKRKPRYPKGYDPALPGVCVCAVGGGLLCGGMLCRPVRARRLKAHSALNCRICLRGMSLRRHVLYHEPPYMQPCAHK